MSRGMQWLIGILLGVLIVIAWLAGGNSGLSFKDGPSESSPMSDEQRLVIDSDGLRDASTEADGVAQDAQSWAHKLAILNAGEYVTESEPTVIRFRSLMRTNALQVPETEDEIAKLTLATWRILRERYGREVGLLELTEDANRVLYSQARVKRDYAALMSDLIETMQGR